MITDIRSGAGIPEHPVHFCKLTVASGRAVRTLYVVTDELVVGVTKDELPLRHGKQGDDVVGPEEWQLDVLHGCSAAVASTEYIFLLEMK